MVKAVAGGAVLVAAALPMAAAGVASAATSPTLTATTGVSGVAVVQQGGSNTIHLTGTLFANDGGPVTISTNAPGVSVAGATESSFTAASAVFSAAASATPGFYSVTLTDDNGTVTLANALGVIAGPQITTTAPSSLSTNAIQTIAITGTGFKSTGGTNATIAVNGGAITQSGTLASPAAGHYVAQVNSATSIYVAVNTNLMPAGTYTVSVVDNASVTSATAPAEADTTFTVVGTTITNINPNGIATTGNTSITITGTGFNTGAGVTLTGCTNSATATVGIPVVNSTTSISVLLTTAASAVGQCNVVVTNLNSTTATAAFALGIGTFGQPIVPAAGSIGVGALNYGANTVAIPTSGFTPTTGATVSLYDQSIPTFTLTGTVVAVSGGTAYVSVTVPRFATTTLATAASAGASSVTLASVSGVTGNLTIVDGANSEMTASGAITGNSVAVSPSLVNAHAAGVTVEFPYPTGNYVASFNNGVSTVQNVWTVTAVSPGASLVGTAVSPGTFVGTVATGQTVNTSIAIPGFNLGTGATISFVSQSAGNSQGVTGTIKVNSPATATAAITLPLSTIGSTTLFSPMNFGDSQATLVSAVGLSVGSTVTITTAGNYAQTFTITNIVGNVVYFGTTALTNFAAGNKVTSTAFTSVVATGNYTAVITNGSGQVIIIPAFMVVASATQSFSGIFVAPAVSGAAPSLGAGATNVLMDIVGTGFTNVAYSVTSTSPGVTFTGTTYVSGTLLTTLASVAAGTAPIASVPITVSSLAAGGTQLPSVAAPAVIMSTIAAPTITSVVASATSFSVGNGGTLVVTGTGFTAGTTVTVIAGAGNNAGGQDIGTLNSGTNGVVCNVVGVITSTNFTCTLVVGGGSSAGTDSILVTAGGNFGTATSSAGPVIVAPVATSVTPNAIDSSYTGTFIVGLSGVTITPTSVPTAVATWWDGLYPYSIANNGSAATSVAVNYYTATSVKLTVTGPNYPAGDMVAFTLTSGLQSFDTPMISVGAGIISAAASPAVSVAPGTSATVTVVDSADGANAFTTGTALYFTGTGVTFAITSITPNTLVATVTAAATATPGTFTVGNGGVGSYVVTGLTLGTGPTVSSPSVLVPFAAPAGKATTLVITGTGFAPGVVVSASTGVATFGTAVVSNFVGLTGLGTTITVPITMVSYAGTVPVSANLIVTNPGSYGSVTVVGALVANPGPSVAGTYYVPTFSKNAQVNITGTGFQAGMTATSTGSGYTVILGGVTPTTATLLVTTDSSATSGTSAQVTFTNPDGGTVTFALNGGPVPVNTGKLTISAVKGYGKAGTTRAVTIAGTGFVSGVSIKSGKTGISFQVVGVSANAVRVHITVAKNVKAGMSRLILTNGNGAKTTKPYKHI